MRHVGAALVCCVLCACASVSQPPKAWYKTGATQQDFNRSTAQCRMQAAGIQPASREGLPTTAGGNVQRAGLDLQDAAVTMQFMQDCMTAQGWTLR